MIQNKSVLRGLAPLPRESWEYNKYYGIVDIVTHIDIEEARQKINAAIKKPYKENLIPRTVYSFIGENDCVSALPRATSYDEKICRAQRGPINFEKNEYDEKKITLITDAFVTYVPSSDGNFWVANTAEIRGFDNGSTESAELLYCAGILDAVCFAPFSIEFDIDGFSDAAHSDYYEYRFDLNDAIEALQLHRQKNSWRDWECGIAKFRLIGRKQQDRCPLEMPAQWVMCDEVYLSFLSDIIKCTKKSHNKKIKTVEEM